MISYLYNSSFNKLGQYQWGLNLSRNFSKTWCILSSVWVYTQSNPWGESGLNSISSSKCSLTWNIMTWNLMVQDTSISKSFTSFVMTFWKSSKASLQSSLSNVQKQNFHTHSKALRALTNLIAVEFDSSRTMFSNIFLHPLLWECHYGNPVA